MKKIKLSIEIDLTEQDVHPLFVANLTVKGNDEAGVEWVKTYKVDGRSEIDAINTACRTNKLPETISAIALAISQPLPSYTREVVEVNKDEAPATKPSKTEAPAPKTDKEKYDEERDRFYQKLNKDLHKWKVGEIRKFIADQSLNVGFRNGTSKKKIAELVIAALQEKEKANGQEN